MRTLGALILLGSLAMAQESAPSKPAPSKPALVPGSHPSTTDLVIPAGTKVPIALKNTISTKSNHEGDPIYAQSTFPVVIDEKIVIPAGTYVQGKIISVKPARSEEHTSEL